MSKRLNMYQIFEFQHKQTLNDRHFSLGYRDWAYNISLERS